MAKKGERESMYDTVLITPIDIPKWISICRQKNEVPIFMGSPGLGKTSSIMWSLRAEADDLGKKFIENPTPEDWLNPDNFCVAIVLASQIDETDSKGIPHIVTCADGSKVTVFTPTEMFPRIGCGAVVLDEFPNGRSQVQNALQQMILDHKAGNYPISKDVMFILAGNKPSDNCGTYNIPQAMRNRVLWFEVTRPTIGAWLQKMEDIGQPINPTMAAWLLSVGAPHFDNLGAAAEQYAYGSPRSITKASKLIEGMTDMEDIKKAVGACIGRAAGIELADFIELTKKVDVEAIIKNPASINNFDTEPGLLYSVSLALIDKCVETPAKLEHVLAITLNVKKNEYGVFIFKGLMQKWGDARTLERINKCPNRLEVMQKYYKILKADAATK